MENEILQQILKTQELMFSEMQKTNQRLDKLEQEVKDVKNRVIVIEEDHGKKLGIILDSYSQLYDISAEIRSDISHLKAKEEKHDMKIEWLMEKKAE